MDWSGLTRLARSLFAGGGRATPPEGSDPGVVQLSEEVDRGLALFREGHYLEASRHFNTARMGFAAMRATDPGRPVPVHVAMAPVHWAHAAFALGRLNLASSALLTAVQEFPELPAVRYRRQAFYGHREEYERTFAALLARLPAEPGLEFLAGYECWFNGRRGEAEPHLQAAVRHAAGRLPASWFLAVLEVDHHGGVDRVQQFETLVGEGLDRRALAVGREALLRALRRLEVPVCLYRWSVRVSELYGRHPEADSLHEHGAVLMRAAHLLGPDLASRLLEECALHLARGGHGLVATDLLALARRRARELRSPERLERLEALSRHLRGD